MTSDFYANATKELAELSERDLQSLIVEPLLKRKGFKQVRDNSGPTEKGKDLVAIKDDEFGRNLLYAIQLKKFAPTANVASSRSFGAILAQLHQALSEPVLDPLLNEMRVPDQVVFVTPYEVKQNVRDAFREQLRRLELRNVVVLDGISLVDQIRDHMPEAIDVFSMSTQYSMRLAKSLNRITEAAVAFDQDELELNNIYVSTSLSQSQAMLHLLATGKARPIGPQVIVADEEDIELFTGIDTRWKSHLRVWDPPRKKRGATRIAPKAFQKYVEIDLSPLVKDVRQAAIAYYNDLKEIDQSDSAEERCTEIVAAGMQLTAEIDNLMDVRLVADNWPTFKTSLTPPSITAENLVKVRHCIHVRGAPGAGKTTLLRRIAMQLKSQVPVFVPLVTIRDVSEHGLVNACIKSLTTLGYHKRNSELSPDKFCSLVRAGEFRLFLDGLDEAGSQAAELMDTIKAFAKACPACPVVLSSRDTYNFRSWPVAFEVRLSPFDGKQLSAFIARWFSTQPTAHRGLIAWLQQNKKMRKAAQTPLIAALLCSLYDARSDMPTTEVELYQQRFELLLGKWEQAKRIQPLPTQIRKRYWLFLMAVANEMHRAEVRATSFETIMKIAKRYVAAGFNTSIEEMVQDCVGRGILVHEAAGGLSFGHLTYQEYLAGRWLSHNNPVAFIVGKICDSWWLKTIDFYACIQSDITPLVEEAISYAPSDSTTFDRINQLALLAPLTSDTVLQKFRRRWRS